MHKKNKKYILVEPNGDITRWIFHDVEDREDVEILLRPVELENKYLEFLRKVHFSYKLNKIFPLPFKGIWDRYYTLEQCTFDPDFDYFILIGNFAIRYFDLNYLRKLRKKYNAKIVLYFEDPICSEYAQAAYETSLAFDFDYVYTFDYADAEKYGFLYMGPVYSRQNVDADPAAKSGDVYFIGVDKGRLPLLQQIGKHLTAQQIKFEINVAGVTGEVTPQEGIIYNERLSYREVVETLQNYTTVLDVLQSGQSGLTLRYYEAICYNKKLITNNESIRNMPFYSPQNVLIFQDPKEITADWIRSGSPNYGYQNEFSPYLWFQRIGNETLEENRKLFPV
jgi:hypothetical protein